MADPTIPGNDENSETRAQERALREQQELQAQENALNIEPEAQNINDINTSDITMAGTSGIGNAPLTQANQALQNKTPENNAQFQVDEDRSRASDYTTGVQKSEDKIINDALTGADGRISGKSTISNTGNSASQEEKERKAAAERQATIFAMSSMADVTQAIYEATAELEELEELAAIADNKAQEALDKLEYQAHELNVQIRTLEEELTQISDPEKRAAIEQELSTKRELATNIDEQLSDLRDARKLADKEIKEARAELEEAKQEAQTYKDAGNRVPESVQQKMERASHAIKSAEHTSETFTQEIKEARTLSQKAQNAISSSNTVMDGAASSIENNKDLSTPEREAQLEMIATIKASYQDDGIIDYSELNVIQEMRDKAGFTDEQVQGFIKNVEESGLGLTLKDSEDVMYGDEASEYLNLENDRWDNTKAISSLSQDDQNYKTKLAELYEERYQLEKDSLMCYAPQDIEKQNQIANSTEKSALSQAELRVEQATQNTVTYGDEGYEAVVYKAEDGTFHMQTNDGNDYKIDSPEILADIENQLANGKTLGNDEIKNLQDLSAKATLDLNTLSEKLDSESNMYNYSAYQYERASNDTETSFNTATNTTELMGSLTDTTAEAPALKANEQYMALSTQINDKIESGTISKNDYDEIMNSASPEMQKKVSEALTEQNITINDPENKTQLTNNGPLSNIDSNNTLQNSLGVVGNTMVAASFPIIGVTGLSVPSIQTSQPQQNQDGIHAKAPEYSSFADSPEFAATNPAGPTSYNEPVNNNTQNLAAASNSFGEAMTNQPSPEEVAQELQRTQEAAFAAKQHQDQMMAMQMKAPQPNNEEQMG